MTRIAHTPPNPGGYTIDPTLASTDGSGSGCAFCHRGRRHLAASWL